jgi:hypothetical protein
MPQLKRKRRRTWPRPVTDRLGELFAIEGLSPAKAKALLDREFPEYRDADLIPSERTLYDMRRELGSTSGAWSLLDGDPEDARLALPVMREMNRVRSGGTLGWRVSKELVRWIARVRIADPEIPLREAFFQALRYLQAENGVRAPAEADRYLVLQLWREKETLR